MVIVANGDKQNSDIKWNAWSGMFSIQLHDEKGTMIAQPFFAEVNPFTGNCGIKAISHIRFTGDQAMTEKERAKWRDEVFKLFEGFLYHVCNAGFVVGSDSGTKKKYYEQGTGWTVEKYGEDYTFSDWTWNPNYTWSKEHSVAIFSKNLVGRKYPGETWSPLGLS